MSVYEKLTAPFPEEAYSKDSSRGFDLTSIKAQYVVERLNETFGYDGWAMEFETTDTQKGVLCVGKLHVGKKDTHTVQGVGYADWKKNVGDTYKSAITDCRSKCASIIGVGNDVFKGKVSADAGKRARPTIDKVLVELAEASGKKDMKGFVSALEKRFERKKGQWSTEQLIALQGFLTKAKEERAK